MGRLGAVQRVDVKKVFRRSSKGWRSQYGALLEGGIHFVALISDIFNDSPIKVSAHFPRQGKGEVERSSIVEMVYGSGATARLSYSWETSALAMGAFQHSTITGDRGVVIFESNGLYVWLKSQGLTKLYFPQLTDLLGYKSMIHDFLSCLEQDGRMPYSNITRARRDLGIVFLAYRQLEKSGNS
jgi:predicted dehydrogenase